LPHPPRRLPLWGRLAARLHREELTGALGPLLDMDFFRRVYIDSGVVAWPGDIGGGKMDRTGCVDVAVMPV